MGPGVNRKKKVKIGKSSKNKHILVLIFWSTTKCLVYSLIKCVSHYDFSVLSMSVMGFPKQKLDGGGGGVSSIQYFLGIFLSLQSHFSASLPL